jgi:TorA maturation chaperone TorD
VALSGVHEGICVAFDQSGVLTGQRLVCGLLGLALFRVPRKAWLDRLIGEDVFEDVPYAASQADTQAGLALLRTWAAAHVGGVSAATLDQLEADYNRLFVGPRKLLAAPWESVYIDRERVLFQRVTLEVKGWYERFGLVRDSACNEPEDHVGLELSFLAHLASIALDAMRRRDDERVRAIMTAQREFVRDHARRWIPNWCRDVEKHAATPFYRGIGRLTRGVVKELDEESRRPQ